MQISVSKQKSLTNFTPAEVGSLADISKLVTKYDWSGNVYKDNYRNVKNFIATKIMALDIDNTNPDSIYTMEMAKKDYSKYAHLIAPTQSHMKDKNGVTAPRFRIVFELTEIINNVQDYKATYQALLATCPHADSQTIDAGRFWYASTGVFNLNDGVKWPVSKYVKPALKVVEDVVIESKGQTSSLTANFLVFGAEAGTRNGRLFKAAKDLQEQGYTREETVTLIQRMIDNGGSWGHTELTAKDLGTIDSAYREVPKHPPRQGEAIRKSCFNFQTLAQLEENAENIDWVVGDLLSVGGFSIIAGPPKAGKSTIIRQLAKSVAEGGNFLGRDVSKGRVLYFSFEEQGKIIVDQFKTLGVDLNDPNFILHVGDVFDDRAIDDLKAAIIEMGPAIVVLDTIFDISNLEDINSYKPVKDALKVIRNIARETNCHILGVHHSKKGSKGFLGSQAIYGAVDTMLTFDEEGDRRYLTTKQKHGIVFDDHELMFDPDSQTYTLGQVRPSESGRW